MQLSFSILGPLTAELLADGSGPESVEVDVGPFKQRLLLALLLCRCNSVVLVEQIIDALWWDGPPPTAHKNVQVYISHLRKLLEADGRRGRIRFRPPGYQLTLSSSELDVLRFEDLAREGRLALRRGDPGAAAAATRDALRLWRDAVLTDMQISPVLRGEADRLQERRLAVFEDWFDTELQLGNHAEVLDEIEEVVRAHPLRERLRSHQMTALYRGGRQAEALAEYDNLRQQLSADLGLDPSPALQRLYKDILAGDPVLNGPVSASPVRGPQPDLEVVAHATIAGGGPAGLPRAADDFTGRRHVLARLLAHFGTDQHGQNGPQGQLQHGKFAAFIGPPGAGTTTVALRAAHVLAPRFRDGAIFLPLRDDRGDPRPPAEVQEDLLARLDAFPRPASEATADRGSRLRGRLARLQLLLLLDGAVSEAQVRELLPGTGSSSVILTSYRHLGGLGGLARFRVGVFSEDEALDLLRAILGAERVDRELPGARCIVQACGLLPLAVRVAGARLAALADLPLDRFASRLEDPERILEELAIEDLSVRDRLEQFVRGLDAAERVALVQVAAAWAPPMGGPGPMEQQLERLAGVHALTITSRDFYPAECPAPFDMPRPLWVYARQLLYAGVFDARA